jgi:amidophosphoribosyltransferase
MVNEDSDDDHFHDQCGVFGIWGSTEASNHSYLGLHALQHRGQEAAGIVSSDGSQLFAHRGLGLVQDVFNQDTLGRLPGDRAIGHVRYSTAGGSHVKNAQPLTTEYAYGPIAIAHNGNLTNSDTIRRSLELEGAIFQTTSDTEVILHLVARSKGTTTVNRVIDALRQTGGAFSLVILTPTEMIAVRDPRGFRPLSMGRLGNAYVFASEPVAFEVIGASHVRDIEPGEMLVVTSQGVESLKSFDLAPTKMCLFEYIYFSRPDSTLDGINVYEARKRMGRALAIESPVPADIVVPVPDSGVPAALGVRCPFRAGYRSQPLCRAYLH